VLAGQQRGRADHRDLHARQRGDKGRAHRHLGLAEAHVADDQPVHRAALFQIGHHIGDGRKLVVGFLIGEAGGKGLPHRMRRLQDRGVAQRAFGRDPHQPVGDLLDAFLQLGLLGLPGAAAQTVQKPLFMAIAAEQFDVLDRQVKLGVVGIFQRDAGMGGAKRGDRLDPQIAADAMFDMHHQIAGRQRIDLAQEVLGLALARRGFPTSRSPSTSCSEITARPGAVNPASSAQTTRNSPPLPGRHGAKILQFLHPSGPDRPASPSTARARHRTTLASTT
jgi:hypothetical protein